MEKKQKIQGTKPSSVVSVRLSTENLEKLDIICETFGVRKQEIVEGAINEIIYRNKLLLDYPEDKLFDIVDSILDEFVNVGLLVVEGGTVASLNNILKLVLITTISRELEPMQDKYPAEIERPYDLFFEADKDHPNKGRVFLNTQEVTLLMTMEKHEVSFTREEIFDTQKKSLFIKIRLMVLALKKLLEDMDAVKVKELFLESINKSQGKEILYIYVNPGEPIRFSASSIIFPMVLETEKLEHLEGRGDS